MARTKAEFDHVKQLMAEGLTDPRIAKLTGIPLPTVRSWRHRAHAPGRQSPQLNWRVPDAYAYGYPFGCYLGDGTVAHPSPNGWELRLYCDQRYVDIMDEIRAAAILTFPGRATDDLEIAYHRASGRSYLHILVLRRHSLSTVPAGSIFGGSSLPTGNWS